MATSEVKPQFGRLKLNYRCRLPDWYKKHLFETRDGFDGTPHVLWTGWVNSFGFPSHKIGDKILPLNGYILYKCEDFTLAADERISTICGVLFCMQTAHFKVGPKRPKKVT